MVITRCFGSNGEGNGQLNFRAHSGFRDPIGPRFEPPVQGHVFHKPVANESAHRGIRGIEQRPLAKTLILSLLLPIFWHSPDVLVG